MAVAMSTYCWHKNLIVFYLIKDTQADSVTYADKLYSQKSKRLQILSSHSDNYVHSSPVLENCELKVLIIEVLAFRNVYNTNNTLELFQLINRHVSVSNVLK